LEGLRDGLAGDGWRQATLVRDFRDIPGDDAYRKSIRALYQSDMNLLVFLKGCAEGGVSVEATHVLNDSRLVDKSVFLVESDLQRRFISELVDDRPEFRKAYHREVIVGNDADLLEQASGALVSVISRRPFPLNYFK